MDDAPPEPAIRVEAVAPADTFTSGVTMHDRDRRLRLGSPRGTRGVQIVRSSRANSASKWRSAAPSSYMAVSAMVYPWAAPA